MAVASSQVAVATSAVALNTASTSGLRLVISNGAAVVFLGSSAVTTSTGASVAINGLVTVELDAGDVLYAISATSSTVGVLST